MRLLPNLLLVTLLSFSCSKEGKDKGDAAASTDPNIKSTQSTDTQNTNTPQDPEVVVETVEVTPPPKAPAVNMKALVGFGPYSTPGSQTLVEGSALPNGGDVTEVGLSVRKVGQACLNADHSAFDAECPHYLEVDGLNIWELSLPDSLFEHGEAYGFTAFAKEASGLQSKTNEALYTWDANAPADAGDFTITAGEEALTLNWNPVMGATKYLVVAKLGAENNFLPSPGALYATGDTLLGGYRVAYFGNALSRIDNNLPEFKEQTYRLFAFDDADNISNASTASSIPAGKAKFRGITYAGVNSTSRLITVEWQQFFDGLNNPETFTYKVYAATSPGGQNFSAPPAASVVGGSSLTFKATGTSPELYLVVRAQGTGSTDSNTKEFKLSLGKGSHQVMGANSRFNGLDPANAYLQTNWAVEVDNHGNVIFSGAMGTLHVLCNENSLAPYCRSRALGRFYTIAGRDGIGDSTEPASANETAMGNIFAIEVDGNGNIFLADYHNRRVRVICYAPHLTGVCRGKEYGYSYVIAGNGVAGDGLDGVAAIEAPMGFPYGLALDSKGNVYIGDFTYRRVRVVCYDTVSSGFCSGKTVGNSYRFAGTGANADGASDVAAASAPMGAVGDLAIDSKDNIYVADAGRYRIRVVCQDVSAGSFCGGKTAGNIYHLVGTGSSGIGGDNEVATTSAIGQVYGLAIDDEFNVYMADVTYRFVRTVCLENSGSDFCGTGATVGNVYLQAGTGGNTDGANGLALSTPLGDPRGLSIDGDKNLYLADSRNLRLRAICNATDVDSYCEGLIPGYHYQVSGRGAVPSGNEYALALNEPLGNIHGTAVDPDGNIYLTDTYARRVLVICQRIDNGGVCGGKTQGHVYHYAGTGAQGNGASGGLALARAMGTAYGLDSDSGGNIYIADNTYRTLRVVCWNTAVMGACNGATVGYSYGVAGTGAAGAGGDNVNPATTTLGNLFDVAVDSYDNVYFSDETNRRVQVICYDVASPGFCSGRTAGNMYFYAGSGANGDGADNGVATATAMGSPRSIALDASNNLFIGDYNFARVRAVCHDINAGFCLGKTAGRVYRVAGTGAAGNGADDSVAATTAMGAPAAMAVDAYDNIYVADYNYMFIRAICFDGSASGFCAGKTSGNVYRLFGSGTDLNGASNSDGAVVHLGQNGWGGLDFTLNGGLLRVDEYYSLRAFMP